MKTSLRHAATPQRRSRPRVIDQPKRPSSGQHPRRRILSLAVGAAALPAVSWVATAQTYPTRPITMIVPFAAGGPADLIGRVVAEHMKDTLGQTIIVENVGGAEGNIGTGRVARARPDGYTIGLGYISTHVMNGAFYSLPYDVLNDFTPISLLLTVPAVLYVRKAFPAKDLDELIRWLQTNPKKATAGVFTSSGRILFAALQKEIGTQFTLVPYRGAARPCRIWWRAKSTCWLAGRINCP
jgi:tripartite-type tricarboxylate transporter receptor subunit TctC